MKLKASTRNCKYFDSVKVKFLKSETSTKEMPGARGPGVGLQFPKVNCAGAVYPLGLTQSLSERWKPDVGCMLSDFMVVRPGKAECLIGTPTELPQKG